MVSDATIISSTIQKLPKESILDGNNCLDWELHVLTLPQYHCISNAAEETKPNPKATSTILSSAPTQVATDSWLDKYSHGQAFMFFSMKP